MQHRILQIHDTKPRSSLHNTISSPSSLWFIPVVGHLLRWSAARSRHPPRHADHIIICPPPSATSLISIRPSLRLIRPYLLLPIICSSFQNFLEIFFRRQRSATTAALSQVAHEGTTTTKTKYREGCEFPVVPANSSGLDLLLSFPFLPPPPLHLLHLPPSPPLPLLPTSPPPPPPHLPTSPPPSPPYPGERFAGPGNSHPSLTEDEDHLSHSENPFLHPRHRSGFGPPSPFAGSFPPATGGSPYKIHRADPTATRLHGDELPVAIHLSRSIYFYLIASRTEVVVLHDLVAYTVLCEQSKPTAPVSH